MFRHFAVITLAVTCLLALFASGENRQALEQKVAEKREKNELREADLALAKQGKGGNTGLVFKDNRTQKASWGLDEGNAETTYALADGEGSPELTAGTGPRYIDMTGGAGAGPAQAAVAPPGMTSRTLTELRKKKKKSARQGWPGRRPPPTEEEAAEF